MNDSNVNNIDFKV